MATEQLLVLQPVVTGQNVVGGGPIADSSATGAEANAFLQALLQRLRGGVPDDRAFAAVPSSSPLKLPTSGTHAEQLAAFVEQVKVLTGQTAVTAMAEGGTADSGNQVGEGGNVLPGTDSSAGDPVVLTPEQLEQLVARFMSVQAPAESRINAEPPISAGRGQGATAQASAGASLLAATARAAFPSATGDIACEREVQQPAAKTTSGEKSAVPKFAGLPVGESPAVVVTPVAGNPVPPGPVAPDQTNGEAKSDGVATAPRTVPAPASYAAVSFLKPLAVEALPTETAGAEIAPSAAGSQGDAVATGRETVLLTESAASPEVSTPHVRQTDIADGAKTANEADGSVPAVEAEAPDANGVVVAGSGRNAEHGKSSNSTSGSPVTGSGLTLPPGLLRAVALHIAKSGGYTPSVTSVPESLEPAASLVGAEQARPDVVATSQAVLPQSSAATESQHPEPRAVSTFLGKPGWSEDLGQHVVWLTGKEVQSAELQLNPRHLGPIEVRIDMTQDQASIQFVAHHAGVREALEAAIPKLREMLGNQQLNLADVSVTQQSFSEHRDYRGAQFAYDQQSQSNRQGQPNFAERSGGGAGPTTLADGEQPAARRLGRGRLSLYA